MGFSGLRTEGSGPGAVRAVCRSRLYVQQAVEIEMLPVYPCGFLGIGVLDAAGYHHHMAESNLITVCIVIKLCHIPWHPRNISSKIGSIRLLRLRTVLDIPSLRQITQLPVQYPRTPDTPRMYEWDIARPCRSTVINQYVHGGVHEGTYAYAGKRKTCPGYPRLINISQRPCHVACRVTV